MANDECNKLLVCWEQHRRFIYVDNNDNLDTIKQSIIKVYSLQQSIGFINYQIQYYDEIYQTFIDLSDNTLDDFRELLQKLQTSDISTRNEKIWCLNVIPNKMARINLTSSDPVTVDINNYPPKKNSDKSIEQSTSETNNQIDDSTSSLDSMINITDLYGVSTSSQVESRKRHKLSNESDFVISPSLKFRFEIDIANHQRRQYESDMVRKGSSNSILGGVLLRGSNTNDPALHPLVYFEIPQSQWKSRWSLRLYILTECDSSGTFYRHASKGIYDNVNKLHDRFAPIENSNLVNPDVIYLSSDQIKQGRYEIRLRVCNIHNLPMLKKNRLRKIPEIGCQVIYNDPRLLSTSTSNDLKFSSEKYHLGCLLVCENQVRDRCISQMAIEDKKRKRKDT